MYNLENLLKKIIDNNRSTTNLGQVASYIPELKKADPNILGIYITTTDGKEYHAGDWNYKFTIQSISKIITLMIVLMENGKEKVFSKVSMEPTADAFNSIINLETKNKQKPLNPMINAGAIATTSMLQGNSLDEKFDKILNFTRKLTGNDQITINEAVYLSEKKTGHRNRALAYYMKSTGILEGDVENVLDLYFKQCSLEINCMDISRIGAMLACDGVLPWNGERIIQKDIAKFVKTVMVTCGMYDASGQFAVDIGIPAKSGVGGGILAAVPGKMGIGVVGPALDSRGNSIAGINMLKDLSEELELSIF